LWIQNEGETSEGGGDTDQSEAKEGNSSANVSEFLPPQPSRQKNMTEGRCLQKASELLPACSNQAMDDECQHFWKMIASELVNYNDMV
jgi:hypothetical protein